ncbi:ATP-dependent DNA helicase RecQ [Paenibacillus sp. PR3]|uniref:ATP-dependent DNA helicase RecQ n=1 Tax=Paenibacillus terricola TaxID=2763503 RepID=A0ABR8MYP4_9BACL|nr:protein DpdF [Paenibacillus terricola]MBD3921003.1 ATP-dependent DNA helicase RecQ [Paenibacillus terricola]
MREWIIGERKNISFTQPEYSRFMNAINKDTCKPKDIAILLRQIIRTESEKQNGAPVSLTVPTVSPWPSMQLWQEFGVEISLSRPGWLSARANSWFPSWLENLSLSPETPLYRKEVRQTREQVEADPFVRILSRSKYRSKSQQDAIRSIITSPADSSLVINLPTGTGKSMCAQLPALMFGQQKGVTVVIVPTIALAIDQESAMSTYVPYPTAYYSSPERRTINQEILTRIQSGTQKIVFTSPEAVIQSLHYSLQRAVEQSYLKLLVIDEAHMVEEWGSDFRSAFQELAGWRTYMLAKSPVPFRTLLLTATLTNSSLDTLESLFGRTGHFDVYSAVQLRPEPEYWFKKCQADALKEKYILEAIAHLPRPLILYTSKVDDAIRWQKKLIQNGYSRIGCITGKTRSKAREDYIIKWKNQDIDIMVATSAFGLGVDQADVRVVIHACVPETLDRYYQEVGRGGRDGIASLSLIVYTEEDIDVATSLSKEALISIERGQQRWTQMFLHKKNDPQRPDVIKVPIDIQPSFEEKDIDMDNNKNRTWNLRTLTLMNRTGLISFEWSDAREKEQDKWRTVKLRDDGHLKDERWEAIIHPYRIKSGLNHYEQLDQVKRLLSGQTCVALLFSSIYQISYKSHRKGALVAESCAGCPYCRQAGLHPFTFQEKSHPIQWKSDTELTSWVERSFIGSSGMTAIFYNNENFSAVLRGNQIVQDRWLRVFHWWADQGIRQFVVPHSYGPLFREDQKMQQRHIIVHTLERETFNERVQYLPTLMLTLDSDSHQLLIERALNASSNELVYIIPEHSKQPITGRSWSSIWKGRQYKWDEFVKEVGL